MEEGMRQFPVDLGPKERWTKIGEVVDDKTPKECYARFKELVSKMQKRKTQ